MLYWHLNIWWNDLNWTISFCHPLSTSVLVLLSVIRKDTIYVSFKLSYSALTVSEYFTGANIQRKIDIGPTFQILIALQCDLMRICMYFRKMVLQNVHFLTFAIDTETYNTDVFTASKHTILTYWQHLKRKSYLRMNYFTDLQMNPYEYSVVIPMALLTKINLGFTVVKV